ncbi:MAG: DUF4062 domain-containing protein [Lachnoclostridium sp.]|nr:DUF4062 domain-containing protein [Lachnoclostridium sp.]
MTNENIALRRARVFVSSTFSDMESERNYLATQVFPQIASICEDNNIFFFPVDLRWGITEQESKAGNVVKLCLEEIENSTPFFIGLLGERYGWTPLKQDLGDDYEDIRKQIPWIDDAIAEGKSITEMEFIYGVLSRDSSRVKGAFYIRKDMNPEPRQRELIEKVVAQNLVPVRYYGSPQELGQLVIDDLLDTFKKTFSTGADTGHELIKARNSHSISKRLEVMVDFPESYDAAFDKWVDSDSRYCMIYEKILIRNGKEIPKSNGKSTLLCHYVDRLVNCGRSVVYVDMVNIPLDENSRIVNLGLFLDAETTANPPDFIAIDNLDLEEEEYPETLELLRRLSNAARVLISGRYSGWFQQLGAEDSRIEYTPPSDEFKIAAIDKYLRIYGKQLTADQKKTLISKETTMTHLKMALNTLIRFGSFEKLNEEISKLGDGDIYWHLLWKIRDDVGNMKEGNWEAMWVINALAISEQQGLTEREILELSGMTTLRWTQIKGRVLELCDDYGGRYLIKNEPDLTQTILNAYYTNYRDMICDRIKLWAATADIPETRRVGLVARAYMLYIGAIGEDEEKANQDEFPSVFLDVGFVNNRH